VCCVCVTETRNKWEPKPINIRSQAKIDRLEAKAKEFHQKLNDASKEFTRIFRRNQELEVELVDAKKAFEPVLSWYSAGESRDSLADLVVLAIDDLQSDRKDVLRLKQQLTAKDKALEKLHIFARDDNGGDNIPAILNILGKS